MPDHTEREREARMAVAGGHSLTCSRSLFATTLCNCGGPTRPIAHLDAYRAAVRSAVLAEVRSRMTRHRYGIELTDTDDGYHATMTHRADGEWVHVESLLTQLEATDGL